MKIIYWILRIRYLCVKNKIYVIQKSGDLHIILHIWKIIQRIQNCFLIIISVAMGTLYLKRC